MNFNDNTITDTEGLRLIAWSLEGGNIKMADECRRAADEIERLRADRDRWFKIADDLYAWSVNILGDHMTMPCVEAYEQAVRDE